MKCSRTLSKRSSPWPRLALALGVLAANLGACTEPESSPAGSGPAATVDLVIGKGTVLTMDPELTVHQPGFVAVSGDTIVAVGPQAEAGRFETERTIDAQGRLVLPGLINGHQHAPMVLYRGLADDLKLMDWLEKYIFPAEAATVDADFVYWGTRLAVAEMLLSGTTTYADMYYFEDEVARATSELGMRGVLGQTIIGFPAPDHAKPEDALEYCTGFVERWKNHPLIVPAIAPHAPFTCSAEVLRSARALAEQHDVPLLIHVAESREEVEQMLARTGRRPVEFLEQIGFLTDRVVAKHAVWANPGEIELLQRHGVGVIHNPESNTKLASGVAPVPQMLAAGIDLGLGTDGAASNNNLDLFEAIGLTAKLHKLFGDDPTLVTAREALTAATIGGARALGLEDLVGSLEAGKKADLIVLNLDAPSAKPMYDPYSLVVYSLLGSSVETVLVNGRLLVADRQLLGFDWERQQQQIQFYQDKIQQAVQPTTSPGG